MALIGNLKGPTGTTGTTGTTGAAGSNGTNGAAGTNGTNGSAFLSGAGVPGVGLGNNGDTYLNVTTGDIYTKAAGSW